MSEIQQIRLRTAALIDLTRTHAALRSSIQVALDRGLTSEAIRQHLRGLAAELTDQAADDLVAVDAELWATMPADLQDTVAALAAQT